MSSYLAPPLCSSPSLPAILSATAAVGSKVVCVRYLLGAHLLRAPSILYRAARTNQGCSTFKRMYEIIWLVFCSTTPLHLYLACDPESLKISETKTDFKIETPAFPADTALALFF